MSKEKQSFTKSDEQLKYIGECVLRSQAKRRKRNSETQAFRTSVGAALREIRKQLKISQSDIAEKMGVAYQTILKLEKGFPSKWFIVVASSYKLALKNYILSIARQETELEKINIKIDENKRKEFPKDRELP